MLLINENLKFIDFKNERLMKLIYTGGRSHALMYKVKKWA